MHARTRAHTQTHTAICIMLQIHNIACSIASHAILHNDIDYCWEVGAYS